MIRGKYYNYSGGDVEHGDVTSGVEVTIENHNTFVRTHPNERRESARKYNTNRGTSRRRNNDKYEMKGSRPSSNDGGKGTTSTTTRKVDNATALSAGASHNSYMGLSIYPTSTPPTKKTNTIAGRTATTEKTKGRNVLPSKGVLRNLDQSYPDLEFSTNSTTTTATTAVPHVPKEMDSTTMSSSNELDAVLPEMAIMKKFTNPTATPTAQQSSPTKTNDTTSSYEDDYGAAIVDDGHNDDTYTIKELQRRRKLLIGLIISAIIFCVAIGLTVLGLQQQKARQQVLNSYAIDYSCTNDDDCEVMNVGSCCGTYFPKCVNAGFVPDPSKASCQDNQGMVGGTTTCGYATIDRCGCKTNTDETTKSFCVGYQDDNIVSFP